MHGADRGGAQVVEHEVAVGDRVERVLDDAVESQRAGDRRAAGVPVDARQRARAERQVRGRAGGIREPVEVAAEHPEVGEQVMARGTRAARAGGGCSRASASPRGAPRGRRARPSGRAVAAGPPCTGRARTGPCRSRPGRCATAPCGPCRRPGPAISVRRRSIAMWMSSSSGRNSKRALLELGRDRVEARVQLLRLVRREDAGLREHRHVRLGLAHVVGAETPVEAQIEAFSAWNTGSGGSRKRPMHLSLGGPPGYQLPAIAPICRRSMLPSRYRLTPQPASAPRLRGYRRLSGVRPIDSTTGSAGGDARRHQREPACSRQQPVEARLEGGRDLAEQVVEEDHRDGSRGDQPGDAEEALAAG